jgi:hypothetical protein
MSITLTEHGHKQIMRLYNAAVDDVVTAKRKLLRAEGYLEKMKKTLSCEHEFVCKGGIEAVETQCTKCGVSVYE